MTSPDRPKRSYRIIVRDNFHYQDRDAEYEIDGADTAAEAISKCQQIVEQSLAEVALPGLSPGAIIKRYRLFGEDPFIVPPPGEEAEFSAWTYAEERAPSYVRALEEGTSP